MILHHIWEYSGDKGTQELVIFKIGKTDRTGTYTFRAAFHAKRTEQSKRSLMYVPSDQVLVIQLEDLVTRDREGSIARLLDFLGVDDDPNMRAWFDEVVTPRKGNEGRWRRDYTGEQLDVIDTAYAEIIADLEAREIPHPV